jgi:predicted RecA/RadA family phage recombinase
MKNFVQDGKYLDFTAAADVDSGELVEVGSLHGVAIADVASGAKGVLAMEGVYTLPKQVGAAADAVAAAGDPVYFKTGKVTGDDDTGANKLVGYALAAAAQAVATVQVRLSN